MIWARNAQQSANDPYAGAAKRRSRVPTDVAVEAFVASGQPGLPYGAPSVTYAAQQRSANERVPYARVALTPCDFDDDVDLQGADRHSEAKSGRPRAGSLVWLMRTDHTASNETSEVLRGTDTANKKRQRLQASAMRAVTRSSSAPPTLAAHAYVHDHWVRTSTSVFDGVRRACCSWHHAAEEYERAMEEFGRAEDVPVPVRAKYDEKRTKLEEALRNAGVFRWVPDGVCLSEMYGDEAPTTPQPEGRLFNIGVLGPCITHEWHELRPRIGERVFVTVLVRDPPGTAHDIGFEVQLERALREDAIKHPERILGAWCIGRVVDADAVVALSASAPRAMAPSTRSVQGACNVNVDVRWWCIHRILVDAGWTNNLLDVRAPDGVDGAAEKLVVAMSTSTYQTTLSRLEVGITHATAQQAALKTELDGQFLNLKDAWTDGAASRQAAEDAFGAFVPKLGNGTYTFDDFAQVLSKARSWRGFQRRWTKLAFPMLQRSTDVLLSQVELRKRQKVRAAVDPVHALYGEVAAAMGTSFQEAKDASDRLKHGCTQFYNSYENALDEATKETAQIGRKSINDSKELEDAADGYETKIDVVWTHLTGIQLEMFNRRSDGVPKNGTLEGNMYKAELNQLLALSLKAALEAVTSEAKMEHQEALWVEYGNLAQRAARVNNARARLEAAQTDLAASSTYAAAKAAEVSTATSALKTAKSAEARTIMEYEFDPHVVVLRRFWTGKDQHSMLLDENRAYYGSNVADTIRRLSCTQSFGDTAQSFYERVVRPLFYAVGNADNVVRVLANPTADQPKRDSLFDKERSFPWFQIRNVKAWEAAKTVFGGPYLAAVQSYALDCLGRLHDMVNVAPTAAHTEMKSHFEMTEPVLASKFRLYGAPYGHVWFDPAREDATLANDAVAALNATVQALREYYTEADNLAKAGHLLEAECAHNVRADNQAASYTLVADLDASYRVFPTIHRRFAIRWVHCVGEATAGPHPIEHSYEWRDGTFWDHVRSALANNEQTKGTGDDELGMLYVTFTSNWNANANELATDPVNYSQLTTHYITAAGGRGRRDADNATYGDDDAESRARVHLESDPTACIWHAVEVRRELGFMWALRKRSSALAGDFAPCERLRAWRTVYHHCELRADRRLRKFAESWNADIDHASVPMHDGLVSLAMLVYRALVARDVATWASNLPFRYTGNFSMDSEERAARESLDHLKALCHEELRTFVERAVADYLSASVLATYAPPPKAADVSSRAHLKDVVWPAYQHTLDALNLKTLNDHLGRLAGGDAKTKLERAVDCVGSILAVAVHEASEFKLGIQSPGPVVNGWQQTGEWLAKLDAREMDAHNAIVFRTRGTDAFDKLHRACHSFAEWERALMDDPTSIFKHDYGSMWLALARVNACDCSDAASDRLVALAAAVAGGANPEDSWNAEYKRRFDELWRAGAQRDNAEALSTHRAQFDETFEAHRKWLERGTNRRESYDIGFELWKTMAEASATLGQTVQVNRLLSAANMWPSDADEATRRKLRDDMATANTSYGLERDAWASKTLDSEKVLARTWTDVEEVVDFLNQLTGETPLNVSGASEYADLLSPTVVTE
jgi:hypothetical protein